MTFPPFLYHFGSFNSQHLDSIFDAALRNEFYLSKATNLNDPYEATASIEKSSIREIEANYERLKLDLIFSRKRFKQKFGVYPPDLPALRSLRRTTNKRRRINWHLSVAVPAFRAKEREVSVASLSEAVTEPLMWSHYADRHTGFCLEFSKTGENTLFSGLPIHQVAYSHLRPQISTVDILEAANPMLRQSISPALRRLITTWLLTKSESWHYEREWRLIEMQEGYQGLLGYQFSAVIVGARVSDGHLDWLKRRLPESVSVKREVLSHKTFDISIAPA